MPEIAAFMLNIGSAFLMGMTIGLERQFGQHQAGLRTHTLVCLGAALFVSLPNLIDHESSPTRVAGQVVSGIGFLGGGVILREGFNVRGMNTAATLWCSAAIGTLAGSGLILHGAVGTVAVIAANVLLRPLALRINAQTKGTTEVETLYRIRTVCHGPEAAIVRSVFMRHINAHPTMTVQGLSTQEGEQPGQTLVIADIYSSERNDRYMNEMVSRLSIEPGVTTVSWERVR